jgi:hypothetical protein
MLTLPTFAAGGMRAGLAGGGAQKEKHINGHSL